VKPIPEPLNLPALILAVLYIFAVIVGALHYKP
jgi:hypothetical protein